MRFLNKNIVAKMNAMNPFILTLCETVIVTVSLHGECVTDYRNIHIIILSCFFYL
jgi:hypothetical protein